MKFVERIVSIVVGGVLVAVAVIIFGIIVYFALLAGAAGI